ncbi:MAG: thiamine pyrophosphate-binding protein [Candidatus Aminicenantales bacterium]
MVCAKSVLKELKACGVTHVVGLADNASATLVALLANDDSVRFISVTREGEAFALASGLWIGGKTAVVVVQNTGFLESGDGLRGTAQRMRIPLVCLITYRGYKEMRRQSVKAEPRPWTIEEFSRADLDSAAILTEPTLNAWNVPFDFLETDADLPKIAQAFSRAERESRPVALLVTGDMS